MVDRGGTMSAEALRSERDEIVVGEYRLVYDPSVGEAAPWYMNDHTFVRAREGEWHLIGISSHAAEFVVDADGSEWVSHCGWGQGGVHLAPFEWRRAAKRRHPEEGLS
jgi:hypothetical protein